MKIRVRGTSVSLSLTALFVLNLQPEIVHAQGTSNASNLLGTLPPTQLSIPVPLAQLPAGVVTNFETSSVTLGNVKLGNVQLFGTLYLPCVVTIYSGPDLLLQAGFENNFFAGPDAGNLTTSGPYNTAIGTYALCANTGGVANTANGYGTLVENTSGAANVANGFEALGNNTIGGENTANGFAALVDNTNGNFNTAIGFRALFLLAGGANNIALGNSAGSAFTGNENSNIDIGNPGVAGENNIIRIGTPGIQTATYLAGTVYANGVALGSDRNSRENFASINAQAVLDKVVALSVSEWNYKTDKTAEHIGPMAQDFHAAFGLNGADDKHISVVDENGVALAAIQGLNQKLEALNAENEQLKQENNLLARRLDELEALVKAQSEKTH